MLLRSAFSPRCVFQPAARARLPRVASPYTTSSTVHNEEVLDERMKQEQAAQMSNMIEALERTSPGQSMLSGVNGSHVFQNSRQGNWKPFTPNTFIRPADFNRRFRVTRESRRKPYQLPPSASEARRFDIFRQLSIDPRHECDNRALLSNYITEMGKIKRRVQTKLTIRSQRMVGKAIKRAKMMGIIPVLSRYHSYLGRRDRDAE